MAIRPSLPVRKLVIIEDGLVSSMAADPAFVKEFPFLSSIAGMTPPRGCGSCRRGGVETGQAFSQIKQSLAGMSDDRRRLLKQMLNAQQIRLNYKSGKRIVQHTF